MDDKGKFIWTVKVSDKGQISIPKQAREVFNINTGDTLIMFGDINRGIALSKYDDFLNLANNIFKVKDESDDWN